ncbi:MAG: DUF6807 family protein [Pirellulaceae bacterium]
MRRFSAACVFSINLLFFALAAMASPIQAAEKYDISDETGAYLDVLEPSGKPILRYVYLRDTSTGEKDFDTAKVFAHVLAADGKTTITKGPGGKFPHHRGIFIGWSKLKHGGKRHDLWHVRNTAQLHQDFLETAADENGALVKSLINWIGNHDEIVLEEIRTHRVVAEDDAHAVIDFVSTLKAVNGDVVLDGDPEHAGIQFRPSQQVAENKSATYVMPEEGIDPREDLDLPWVAGTFKVDGQAWTVQHMNHPTNPSGARWSAYRDYGRFGPFTVVEIPDGESQTFRYRFRITRGEAPSQEQFTRHYQRYVDNGVE